MRSAQCLHAEAQGKSGTTVVLFYVTEQQLAVQTRSPFMRRTGEVLCRRDLKRIDTMWKNHRSCLRWGDAAVTTTAVCVCVLCNRDAAACVTMAMAVLHLGSPGADDPSAEETQSGPHRSAGG